MNLQSHIENRIRMDIPIAQDENSVRILRVRMLAAQMTIGALSFLGLNGSVQNVLDSSPLGPIAMEDQYEKDDELSYVLVVDKHKEDEDGVWRAEVDTIPAIERDFITRRIVPVDDATDMQQVANALFDVVEEVQGSYSVKGMDSLPLLADVSPIDRDQQTIGFDIVGSGSQFETGVPYAFFQFATLPTDEEPDPVFDQEQDDAYYAAVGEASQARNLPAPTSFKIPTVDTQMPFTTIQLQQLYELKNKLELQSFDALVEAAIQEEIVNNDVFDAMIHEDYFAFGKDAVFINIALNNTMLDQEGALIGAVDGADSVCALPLENVRQDITVVDKNRGLNYMFAIGTAFLGGLAMGVRRRQKPRVVRGITAPSDHVLRMLNNPEDAKNIDLIERLAVYDYRRALVEEVAGGREQIERSFRSPYLIVALGSLLFSGLYTSPHTIRHFGSEDAPNLTGEEYENFTAPDFDASSCSPEDYILYRRSEKQTTEQYILSSEDLPEDYHPPSAK